MLPFIPARRSRVLEVGCGEGTFSASLLGTEETWGIEPTPAAEIAKNRLTRVLRGTFDDVKGQLPAAYFDLIVCNDVIEHMPNHEAFFREIGRYLSPEGMLIGSIPNVRFYEHLFRLLFEKDWTYTDEGILDRTHLAFFTEKSLRETIARCGLKLVRLEGINTYPNWGRSRKSRFYFHLARFLKFATRGYFADIRHLQFAFQAIVAHAPAAHSEIAQ
jgi:SAM-dependent methyltransferase